MFKATNEHIPRGGGTVEKASDYLRAPAALTVA